MEPARAIEPAPHASTMPRNRTTSPLPARAIRSRRNVWYLQTILRLPRAREIPRRESGTPMSESLRPPRTLPPSSLHFILSTPGPPFRECQPSRLSMEKTSCALPRGGRRRAVVSSRTSRKKVVPLSQRRLRSNQPPTALPLVTGPIPPAMSRRAVPTSSLLRDQMRDSVMASSWPMTGPSLQSMVSTSPTFPRKKSEFPSRISLAIDQPHLRCRTTDRSPNPQTTFIWCANHRATHITSVA